MDFGIAFRAYLFLALLLPCAGKAGPVLPNVTVGVFTVAPFIIANSPGEAPHGVLIDFFDREIAPRMGVKFLWLPPVTVARLEQSLMRGVFTFTPILAKTASREAARIRFATGHFIRFEPCIAVMPEHRLGAIGNIADLAGMTVGWVQSGALPQYFNDARIKFDLVGSVDWERVNLEKLRLGRIDGAYFSDQFTPRYFAAQNGVKVKLLKLPTAGVTLFGAFSPDAPKALVENYQRAAQAAFADGRWESYLAKALATTP